MVSCPRWLGYEIGLAYREEQPSLTLRLICAIIEAYAGLLFVRMHSFGAVRTAQYHAVVVATGVASY